VRGVRGDVAGLLGVLHDTTARRESEEELRPTNENLSRANEDLAQVACSASHDLREPLRMISAYNQLLQRRYEGVLHEQADKFVGFTVQGAQRMEALIRDLPAYSQAMVLADEAEAPEVDAAAVLTRVLSSLQAAVESNGARVTADVLPRLPMHEVHLEQLLQNLIENGLKFRGEEAPVIRITVRRSGTEWLFTIADRYRNRLAVYCADFRNFPAAAQFGALSANRDWTRVLSKDRATLWRPHLGRVSRCGQGHDVLVYSFSDAYDDSTSRRFRP
jgi:signal transduction histidine kinase